MCINYKYIRIAPFLSSRLWLHLRLWVIGATASFVSPACVHSSTEGNKKEMQTAAASAETLLVQRLIPAIKKHVFSHCATDEGRQHKAWWRAEPSCSPFSNQGRERRSPAVASELHKRRGIFASLWFSSSNRCKDLFFFFFMKQTHFTHFWATPKHPHEKAKGIHMYTHTVWQVGSHTHTKKKRVDRKRKEWTIFPSFVT